MKIIQGKTKEAVLLSLLAASIVFLSLNAIKFPQSQVIWSDMNGYYVYLPAVFIQHSFNKEAVRDTNYIKPWPGTDIHYTKYTCGVAVLEAPFFGLAHVFALISSYPADGNSLPYCYGVMIAAIFYMMAGMYLLWRRIREYYSNYAAWWAMAGLFFGTNMYYYTLFQPGMSHIYSFFLFSCIIYLTENMLKARPVWRDFLFFGFVASLMVLIRPTSIIALLYPLYRWAKANDDKLGFLKSNAAKIAGMALLGVMIWLPQIAYWKTVTGQWFIWSYQGESFAFWKEPKLFRVLFDAWNGWLLYSPIAILPLIALFLGRHSNRHSERALILLMMLATYIFASWWAWWFGGAFGHRCYVEYCAFLAIPFAGLVQRSSKRLWSKIALAAFMALLIYYSLRLTYQYQAPWDGPNWTYESVWREIGKMF